MQFKLEELNQEAIYQRAKAESLLIQSGTVASHRNRPLNELINTCTYGQAAEQFLIEKCGFTDDPRRYKDVYDTSGQSVEVKVTTKESNVYYVLKRLNEYYHDKWRNISDIVYVFINDRKNTTYTLEGIYRWNGQHFAKEYY